MKLTKEEQINIAGTYINQLFEQQDQRYSALTEKLNLTKRGEDLLFDYIYNTFKQYDTFEEYFNTLNYRETDIYDEQS